MIVSGNVYDSRYLAGTGAGYDGVVLVSANGYYGTGSLLYNGRAVLTAAHLFKNNFTSATVQFQTSQGNQAVAASKVSIHPNYDSGNGNNDLALVWLADPAPMSANRYGLYRDSDELGSTMTLVGYGNRGNGSTGDTIDNTNATRIVAYNQADIDAATLKQKLGSVMGWTPSVSTQLMADFDNGMDTNDALARLLGKTGLGLGLNEGSIAPGDSGGPAFIKGMLAGVASYTASLSTYNVHPDIDSQSNSSFGEVAAWQRVSYYQQWVDETLRSQLPQAPTKPEAVQKEIIEGDAGITYAYFLLQFTGMRSQTDQWLSVEYTTRDGTAISGHDYISQQGKLVLYPGENQAVIAVEVVGDREREANETFYVDIYNPVVGSFGDGVVKLSAMRTIIDDDILSI